ncbi:hypothetical protein RUM44_008898 [Polyplax serrata]|uniref:Renin receptor n=1 Tax=Polyplax serrata TaxID=468196 RepID=A0ABR1AR52_POLSC
MFLLLILLFVPFTKGGELLIAKNPPSISLQGDETLDQSLLPEVFSSALGFTVQRDLNWQGMKINDPFNLAEALVVLYIDGITSLERFDNVRCYKLNNNENMEITWRSLKNKITDRYPMENNTIVYLNFELPQDVEDMKTIFLDKHSEEDVAFLKEMSGLKNYMTNLKKSNGVLDFYWFNINNLHQLSDLKGPYHEATKEAKDMVYKSLLMLSEKFGSLYNGLVMVAAVVSDRAHTRKSRSVAEDAINVSNDLNGNIYDPDFPVIFNIILWFTVGLVFTLLAVSVFIASMDPGRDSIIYRMTSNRMKKDS